MNLSWKELAFAGLAVLGGFAVFQYVTGKGGVVGVVLGNSDRELGLKRYLAGPKAVAEAAKAAKLGPDAYRDKKAAEEQQKS